MGGRGLDKAQAGRRATPQYIPWAPPSLRDIRQWEVREWRRWSAQFATLNAGLLLFAVGLVLSLQSNLGANSWTVFHDGIARQTPLTIGQASQVVGLLMIVVSWLAGGIRPGIGTVLNMYLIGLFMDIILEHGWVPLAHAYPARVAMLLGSILTLGIATGIYIKAGFGAGPRDSFNLAVMEVTGLSVSLTRWIIETSVVVLGIVMGGRFGAGTILSALLIGPAVGLGFRVTGLSMRPATGVVARDGQALDPSGIMGDAEAARD